MSATVAATLPARAGLRPGLATALLLLAADQASKWWVLHGLNLPDAAQRPAAPGRPFGIDLTMVWNRGVTFGMLSGEGPLNHVILAVLAAAIAGFLLRWLAKAETRMVAIALGAVIGGAIGNVIDRLRFGAVVDFIRAHAWGWDWYVFNIADAGIVCGVVALLADAVLRKPAQG